MTLSEAQQTGHVTVISQAVANKVNVDSEPACECHFCKCDCQPAFGRIVERAGQLQLKGDDVRAQGGIDLETIQKTINLWYSLGLDLFAIKREFHRVGHAARLLMFAPP